MGMSASQARMLTLTARLSDLEYSAQSISNAKIRLADQTEDAAIKYSNALDLQKLTVYDSDTSSYVDTTAYNLTTYNAISELDKQRFLVNNAGQVLISTSIEEAYNAAVKKAGSQITTKIEAAYQKGEANNAKYVTAFENSGGEDENIANLIWLHNSSSYSQTPQITEASENYDEYVEYFQNCRSGLEGFLNNLGYTSNSTGLVINNDNLDPINSVSSGKSQNSYANRSSLKYDAEQVAAYTDLYNAMHREGTYADNSEITTEENTYYDNLLSGAELFMQSQGCTSDPNYTGDEYSTDEKMVQYYQNLFNEITENGSFTESNTTMNDSDWLYNQLNNGTLYIQNWDDDGGKDGTGDFANVEWQSGDYSLKQEDDDSAIAKAEAEYDVAMAQIESKDKKFDLQLKQIDTEHTAVQTEIDSVKKVIDKNIERTFKIFDA